MRTGAQAPADDPPIVAERASGVVGTAHLFTVSIAVGQLQELRKDGLPPAVEECVERAVRMVLRG
jgi:hypothetical protein